MPNYFADNSPFLRFPDENQDGSGLRRAQKGAIFAIGSHFGLSNENALVSMPTGTGKTGVLMMAPYLMRANRILVITPSRMVRDQIAEEFGSLSLLKRLGVLPVDLDCPIVKAVESKILNDESWDTLRDSHVVVTTPMGSSPALENVPNPPEDLFDLLLVDEAHHSPAKTWKALMQAFPSARHILFTATPFRRDRKQLPGVFVYEFPLREAIADGVFCPISFHACKLEVGISSDLTIAKKTEEIYRDDRQAGFNHRVMIRTDSRERAKELKLLYEANTQLQVAIINGTHSLGHVRRTVNKLKNGELDAVICVDMFGEGVDMPQLKIAAIHSPHRSLAVTLQFIGRFARTGGENLGTAKFIAVPEEIEAETKILYQQGAVWENLVTDLSDSRVSTERELRQQIKTFSIEGDCSDESELSLSIIRPFYHSKVFSVSTDVDLNCELKLGSDSEIVQRFFSEELRCVVFVCKTKKKPRWIELSSIQDVKYHLFIVYHDVKSKLLFINSSIKAEDFYSLIADQIVGDEVYFGLSTSKINRALRALGNPSFFSVGLKNRQIGKQLESYRIIAGSKADGAVSDTDAQLFDRGHLFGSGDTDEGKVTLGLSTLSKVWSNRAGFIPEYVAWCRAIGEECSNPNSFATGSRIDRLGIGEDISEIPARIIAASWHETAYKLLPTVTTDGPNGVTIDLLSLDFSVLSSNATEAKLSLQGLDEEILITYRISGHPYFVIESERDIIVRYKNESGSLQDYMKASGLHLYTADFSRIYENQLFRFNQIVQQIPAEAFVSQDWNALNVDICREFGNTANGVSIHAGIENLLNKSNAVVVIYDHRPGELADFVALHQNGSTVKCDIFHCKSSSGKKAASRVGDVYDVAGQVTKSVAFARMPETIKIELTRRLATGSKLIKGTLGEMEQLLNEAKNCPFEYQIFLVQPGISAKQITDQVSRCLASAYDYVLATTGNPPVFWVSE